MSVTISEVYDAFVSAGVPEALSGNERRFDKLENNFDLRFGSLKSEMDARFVRVDGELLLLNGRVRPRRDHRDFVSVIEALIPSRFFAMSPDRA